MHKREFEAFPDWDSVVAHVSAGSPVWYQAPLDRFPVRVDAASRARKRVRVNPPGHDCDPFTADRAHLGRFRRPSSAPYAAMLAESQAHGQPSRFETDLTEHDRAYCESPERAHLFGWVLYDLGTHLAHKVSRSLLETLSELPNARFYIVAGYELRAVDRETFGDVLRASRCRACGLADPGEAPAPFACRCSGHSVEVS